MARIAVPVAVLVSLFVAPVEAGLSPPVFNPLVPDEGPSPNSVAVSGTRCSAFFEEDFLAAQGVAVAQADGAWVGGSAYVQLFDKDDPSQPIGSEQGPYPGDNEPDGEWSGSFLIPAGLKPGTYRARARCDLPNLLPGPDGDFAYDEVRPYRVLAPRGPARAVEAEVSFTG